MDLYLEIAETLRRRIASGELEPGERLLPIREMAARWGCSPGTVSRAYGLLADEGLLRARGRRGTQVASNPVELSKRDVRWASLVNRAERYLLEGIGTGHSPAEVETALSAAVAHWKELQREDTAPAKPVYGPVAGKLRFAGSHDLLLEILGDMLNAGSPAVELSLEFVGSLGGLIALQRGEADLAGAHLWDEETATYNVPFVERVLPGCTCLLLTLALRELGLVLPAGNPDGFSGLEDLKRADAPFVHRQPGSGTRVWLEAQLRRLGIDPESIPAGERIATTHSAVARAVVEGRARVGLAIYAAAASHGLDFLPLTRERYELVIPERTWRRPEAQTLAEFIGSAALRGRIETLGGYDVSQTGEERWVR